VKTQSRIVVGITVAMCLATAFGTVAENVTAEDRAKPIYRVNLHMTSQVEIPPALLEEGQDSATGIFAAIQVQLMWVAQRPPAPPRLAPCVCEATMRDLALQIVPHAPANVSNVALAMAMPRANSGVSIVIFYDRVDPLLRGHAREGKVLGYVLAHEITHVLQGIPRHSDIGVMRARWTENDFRQMGIGTLRFTNDDVRMIRRRFLPLAPSAGCSGVPDVPICLEK
jgi:hypothetical protein